MNDILITFLMQDLAGSVTVLHQFHLTIVNLHLTVIRDSCHSYLQCICGICISVISPTLFLCLQILGWD